jgi:hypothetical protein
VPDLGAVEITTPFDRKGQSPEEARDEADDEARETLADLYGHVAYALKSLDAAPHALATYKAPEPPVTVPTLNLIR